MKPENQKEHSMQVKDVKDILHRVQVSRRLPDTIDLDGTIFARTHSDSDGLCRHLLWGDHDFCLPPLSVFYYAPRNPITKESPCVCLLWKCDGIDLLFAGLRYSAGSKVEELWINIEEVKTWQRVAQSASAFFQTAMVVFWLATLADFVVMGVGRGTLRTVTEAALFYAFAASSTMLWMSFRHVASYSRYKLDAVAEQ